MDFIAWILGDSAASGGLHGTDARDVSRLRCSRCKDDFYQPFKDLLESPNTRHPIPLNPGLPEQAEMLRNVTQAAILGQMTAQEAADLFCQQIAGTLVHPVHNELQAFG